MTVLPNTASTRLLGIRRSTVHGTKKHTAAVQARLNRGLATLSSYNLNWEELGLAARVLRGGTANYAPPGFRAPLGLVTPLRHPLD